MSKIEVLSEILRELDDETLIDDLLMYLVSKRKDVHVNLDRIRCEIHDKSKGIVLNPKGKYRPEPVKVVYRSPDVKATETNSLVKMKTGWDNGLILFGPKTHKRGKISMSFSFRGDKRGVSVGVVLARLFPTGGFVNKTKKGWGYFQDTGCVGHGGPATLPYGVEFGNSGDIVDVELNSSEGTLGFYTNGEYQGIAFDDLPQEKEYLFAVSLMEEGSVVEVYDNYILNPCIEYILMILNRRRDREKTRTELREDLKKYGIRTTTTTTRTRKNSIVTALDFLYNVKDETVLWNILSFVACKRVNVGLWLSQNFESGVDLTSFVPVAEVVKGDEFLAIGSDQDILIRERSLWD